MAESTMTLESNYPPIKNKIKKINIYTVILWEKKPEMRVMCNLTFSSSYICVLFVCAQSCLTLCNPMDCTLPGSSVHGISQQGYWNGLPFSPPGNLPDLGIKPMSPALAGRFFTTESPGKPH